MTYFQLSQKKQKGYVKVSQLQKKEEKKERQRPRDNTKAKTTKELLGELYNDKEFLEKIFDSEFTVCRIHNKIAIMR